MRNVTLIQFIFISLMSLFNIVSTVILVLFGGKTIYAYFTAYSFISNAIYLCIVSACDTSVFIFKSDKLEKLNDFMRNTYSIYSFSYFYTVTVLYWSLVLLGDSFMWFHPSDVYILIFTIYLHAIISIMLLMELAFFPHKRIKFSYYDIIVLSVLYVIYLGILAISKYGLHFDPYTFMKNATTGQLSVCIFSFYLVLINSYQVHIWFVKIRDGLINKYKGNGNSNSNDYLNEKVQGKDNEYNSINNNRLLNRDSDDKALISS